ncbi:MAG: DUF4337 domain-containing protein [Alphaproteobacteria bacterium]|nr:DUF4337 domain-containing protein [Alphaproteobacteria bacterium]
MDTDSKGANERLNNLVAITVVIISVFMAVSNVKDGNIGQNMALEKADAVDTWSEYQSAKLKLHLAENALAQLAVIASAQGTDAALVAKEKSRLEAAITKYTAKSDQLMKDAKAHEDRYNALNVHDDQFDMSEAFLSIALALSAVAALTGIVWLLYVCWGASALGIVMGMAGFLGLSLHSDFVAGLLG